MTSAAGCTVHELGRLRALLLSRAGLALTDTRDVDLERAVGAAMAATGQESPGALLAAATAEGVRGPVLDALCSELTIGETHFFRNTQQFEALRTTVLPDIMQRRQGDHRLRLWSAGCSTGEEAYSLAILLTELLGSELSTWHLSLLATDINTRSLVTAASGRYRQWSMRGVDTALRAAHLQSVGDEWQVTGPARSIPRFEYLNLASDAYPSLVTDTVAVDLILCCYVLIYFDEETRRRVVDRLHRALAPGGWLIVAPADWQPGLFDAFEPSPVRGAIALRARSLPAEAAARPSRRPPAPARRPGPRPVVRPLDDVKASADAPRGACARARELAGALRLKEAEETLRREATQTPMSGQAHYLLGLVLIERGELDSAVVALRRAVYLDPHHLLARFALSGLAARQGDYRRAQRLLDTLERDLMGMAPDTVLVDGEGLSIEDLRAATAAQRRIVEQVGV